MWETAKAGLSRGSTAFTLNHRARLSDKTPWSKSPAVMTANTTGRSAWRTWRRKLKQETNGVSSVPHSFSWFLSFRDQSQKTGGVQPRQTSKETCVVSKKGSLRFSINQPFNPRIVHDTGVRHNRRKGQPERQQKLLEVSVRVQSIPWEAPRAKTTHS